MVIIKINPKMWLIGPNTSLRARGVIISETGIRQAANEYTREA